MSLRAASCPGTNPTRSTIGPQAAFSLFTACVNSGDAVLMKAA